MNEVNTTTSYAPIIPLNINISVGSSVAGIVVVAVILPLIRAFKQRKHVAKEVVDDNPYNK